MKKTKNYCIMAGCFIYMLTYLTDRFIVKISNSIYIVIIIVAIIFVLSGWVKSNQ